MESPQNGDGIKEVLMRAAMEPAFRERLMKDRAQALEGMNLSPTEQELLLVASPEQLEGMIEQARRDPVTKEGVSYKWAAACSLVLGGGLLLSSVCCLPLSLGHTARDRGLSSASVVLQDIAAAERRYYHQFGRYGDQTEIERFLEKEEPGWHDARRERQYTYRVEIVQDKYRIVVRHQTEPDKYHAYVLETGGRIERMR